MKNTNRTISLGINNLAIKYAKDDEISTTALIGMIKIYRKSFNDFLEKKSDDINNFLSIINDKEKNELTSEEIGLIKLLYFLGSSKNLINKKNDTLNKKEFNSYIKLTSKETEQLEKVFNYAKNKMNLKNIEELNNKLQFIISFNNNTIMRKDYFEKAIIEIQKEAEAKKKAKDYRNKNIYNTLFKIFLPKVDQYAYS